MNKTKKRNDKPSLRLDANGNVVLNTSMPKEYYGNLAKIKTAKGFSSEQAVIRFALKYFFDRNKNLIDQTG